MILSIIYLPLHDVIDCLMMFICSKSIVISYIIGDYTIMLKIISIVFIIISVYALFKNNYKNKIWPLYISLLLNILTIVLIDYGY